MLLENETRNDALLLRLALAEQALPGSQAAYMRHRSDLSARFAAARARGDTLHRREEARFRLAIENDANAALALARANWAVQREPADLRVLADAARAAGDRAAREMVAEWIANQLRVLGSISVKLGGLFFLPAHTCLRSPT